MSGTNDNTDKVENAIKEALVKDGLALGNGDDYGESIPSMLHSFETEKDRIDQQSAKEAYDAIVMKLAATDDLPNPKKERVRIFSQEYLPLLCKTFMNRPGLFLAKMRETTKGEITDAMLKTCVNTIFTEHVKTLFGKMYAEIYRCACGVKVYASRSDSADMRNITLKLFVAPAKEATKSRAGKWLVYMMEADLLDHTKEPTLQEIDYALYESEIAFARFEKDQRPHGHA